MRCNRLTFGEPQSVCDWPLPFESFALGERIMRRIMLLSAVLGSMLLTAGVASADPPHRHRGYYPPPASRHLHGQYYAPRVSPYRYDRHHYYAPVPSYRYAPHHGHYHGYSYPRYDYGYRGRSGISLYFGF